MNIDTQREIIKLRRVFALYRSLDITATITNLEAFLIIASSGSTTMVELVKRLDCSKSHTSLIVSLLSQYGRGQKKGMGLVNIFEDPADRRYKLITLTPAGLELAAKLEAILSN